MWSTKADNPIAAYEEARTAVEDAMAPAEPISPQRRPWFEKN